jgi:hypothetical protein
MTMDLYCEHCKEPWDHNHVLDVIPGIRDGLACQDQLETGVKDTEGGWWKFWLVYRNQMFEANYRILMCPACEPRVGQGAETWHSFLNLSCKTCSGNGRVVVWRTQRGLYADGRYYYGYHPQIRHHPSHPFRHIRAYTNETDGLVRQGYAYCPQCFNSQDEYDAAMKEAGWEEPSERSGGILRDMTDAKN